jgi:hypothetical protein
MADDLVIIGTVNSPQYKQSRVPNSYHTPVPPNTVISLTPPPIYRIRLYMIVRVSGESINPPCVRGCMIYE